MRKAGFILLTIVVLVGLCYLSTFLMIPGVSESKEFVPSNVPNPLTTLTTLDWVSWAISVVILAGLALLIMIIIAVIFKIILERG